MPEPPSQGVRQQAGLFNTLWAYFSYFFTSIRAAAELALTLLVAWILANNHDAAVATNNLAFVADFLNAWLYLHDVPLFIRCLRECGMPQTVTL